MENAKVQPPAQIRIETHRNLFAVELLDSDHRSISRKFGALEIDVPPGHYIARCEVGGPTVDKEIDAKSGEKTLVHFSREEIYKMPSAAPVSGSVSRHEYFTDRVSELAQGAPTLTFGSGSRLVLFATRFEEALKPDFGKTRPVSFEKLQLLDAAGGQVSSFPAASRRPKEDIYYGRAGLAIDLDPGGYYLRWPSPDIKDDFRVQPVWMSPNWTTFVFASAFGDSATPRSQTVSIHMSALGAEVARYDDETTAINAAAELALASLRLGRRQLSDDMLLRTYSAKFQNPMLGILGCYLLLSEKPRNHKLLDVLSDYLNRSMDDHPDVRAIDLLRRSPDKIPPKVSQFKFPPMLAQGLWGLDGLEWSRKTEPGRAPDPLLMGSARLARLRALAESPWTTFWYSAPTIIEARNREDLSGRSMIFNSGPLPPGDWPRAVITSPFDAAEVEATQEARASLTQYIAQLRPSADAVRARFLKSQHLSWAGLAPTTALSTASKVLADRAQDSNRLQPL